MKTGTLEKVTPAERERFERDWNEFECGCPECGRIYEGHEVGCSKNSK
jgi:hypothetical protein